jgi:flap endonuclease-1
MGISYIHPEGEAEAYAGELCRIGYVDAVITEDMDTLVYETPLMIRSCIDKSIKNNDYISIFNLSQILKDFDMNIAQFTDLCILCGCDYCPTIPKIGTARAFQNIKKYDSIEKMIESNNIKNIPQEFKDKYKNSRELFKYFNGKIDINNIPIFNSKVNFDKLESYLINDCNISYNRVQSSLNKIK